MTVNSLPRKINLILLLVAISAVSNLASTIRHWNDETQILVEIHEDKLGNITKFNVEGMRQLHP
jgi:hypothetical protein